MRSIFQLKNVLGILNRFAFWYTFVKIPSAKILCLTVSGYSNFRSLIIKFRSSEAVNSVI